VEFLRIEEWEKRGGSVHGFGKRGGAEDKVSKKIGGVVPCRKGVNISPWWLSVRSTGTGLLFLPGGASNREISGGKRETL